MEHDMATTKKLLVRFDIERQAPVSGDFAIPRSEDDRVLLRGIRSSQVAEHAAMVYVGREVTENDLFARLVDSGAYIGDVRGTLASLRNYIEQLQGFKIGNIVRLVADIDTSFRLELVSNTPPSPAAKSRGA